MIMKNKFESKLKLKFLLMMMCALLFLFISACVKPVPSDMVFVKGGKFTVGDGVNHEIYDVEIGDFHLSKHEITNREIVDVYNWAYGKGLFVVDNAPRKSAKTDVGQYYDSDQLRVHLDASADWDLIDFSRPGGKIEFHDGVFKVLDGYEDYPAICVSWFGAVAYCNWRSLQDGRKPAYTGQFGDEVRGANGYRLPTGEEWEYAARGGAESQGFLYSGGNNPDEVGWFLETSGGVMHPVEQKKPNELELYDMSGNVWEMCNEKMGLYRGTVGGAKGLSSEIRLWRGGVFSLAASSVYAFYQIIDYPNYCHGFDDVGFRIKLDR